MKNWKIAIIIGAVVIVLAACGIVFIPKMIHQWQPATCTQPETCIECGKTRGDILPHDMTEATCLEPSHCRNCDFSTTGLGDHQWEEATISAPRTCKICGITDGDPLPCIHSFNAETEKCVHCGRDKSVCPSESEKQQIIDFMYERADYYTEEDGAYDPELRDSDVWRDAKKEFTYLSISDIDDIFFSQSNPLKGELGEFSKKRQNQRLAETLSSENGDDGPEPDKTMLAVIEAFIDEGFSGSQHEQFYDSESHTYYFNAFMTGCAALSSTTSFQLVADSFDSFAKTSSEKLGVDFVASIWDGDLTVYTTRNGDGEYWAQAPRKSSDPTFSATTGELNALESAKAYLNYTAFSYDGLISQLLYEGYTKSEAKYGADHCGADWNEQAAKSATAYLKYTSFSRQGLIDQLEYEGFTYAQAVYGVEQNGY